MTSTGTQGQRLKRLLAARGWNHADLSRRTGIHRETISKYANDRVMMRPSTAEKIAAALDVKAEYLMPGRAADAADRRSLDIRLRQVEETVAELARVADGLAREVRALERRLDDGDGRASGTQG